MTVPKISVVMPVYNGEKYLREAILSILDQSFKDFEFIIVDDGSTDGSEEIIKSFSDDRIVYFKINHCGLVEALNFSISKSKSSLIARMDCDDISVSNRLEKLYTFFQGHQDVVLCGSHAETIGEMGESVGEMIFPPLLHEDIKKYIIFHCPFIHPSVMFKKDAVQIVGGYKRFKHVEDYELWTRLVSKFKTANISDKLIKYRIHQGSVTTSNSLLLRRLRATFIRILAIFRLIFRR